MKNHILSQASVTLANGKVLNLVVAEPDPKAVILALRSLLDGAQETTIDSTNVEINTVSVITEPTVASRYDATVAYTTLDVALSNELERWCASQALPYLSAEELIHENLTDTQRRWVSNFILRWDASVTHIEN